MTLVRWEPFRDLQLRINRAFDEPLGSRVDDAFRSVWSPMVDIYEADGSIVLTAELPGLDPKDIKLSVDQNVLTLSGERQQQQDDDTKTFHRRECVHGAFSRSFALPRLVDRDKISAEYKSGVLKVTIPEAPEARPKHIEVQVA